MKKNHVIRLFFASHRWGHSLCVTDDVFDIYEELANIRKKKVLQQNKIDLKTSKIRSRN